uniref:RRM domain-containing protein n=1 Tax=Alexandrium monilatum TaxID=311494 RepID=A0A7S4RH49_9DINO
MGGGGSMGGTPGMGGMGGCGAGASGGMPSWMGMGGKGGPGNMGYGGASSSGGGCGGAGSSCRVPPLLGILDEKMHRTIFVGGLPKTATAATVESYFQQHGKVSRVELKSDNQGNFRGFGFVTFEDRQVAEHVCRLRGQKFEGKAISCRHADSQGGADPETIFVGGLPRTATSEQVEAHFSQFGKVASLDMKYDEAGKFRGFAFVIFEDSASAEAVYLNYDNNRFDGKWINCRPAVRRQPGTDTTSLGFSGMDAGLAAVLQQAGPLLGVSAAAAALGAGGAVHPAMGAALGSIMGCQSAGMLPGAGAAAAPAESHGAFGVPAGMPPMRSAPY